MNPKTFPQLLSQQTPSQVRYDSCTLPWKNVNEDLAKIIVCKNCICSMLTSIQTYEWSVMISTMEYLGFCSGTKSW